jgi:hypothetical protein
MVLHEHRDLGDESDHERVPEVRADGRALLAFQREQAVRDRPGFPLDTVLDPRD